MPPEPDVPELDVGAVLGALERRGVKFVLIGGMAGVVHGSPFPTEDIDITPERSQENLARLSSALTDLDARVRAESVEGGGGAESQRSRRAGPPGPGLQSSVGLPGAAAGANSGQAAPGLGFAVRTR